ARRVDLPTYPFDHRRYWPRTPRPDTTGTDPLDTEFWTLVDNGELASALDMDPDAAAAVAPALTAWRSRRKARSTVDSWRYQDSWERLRGAPAAGVTGTWLAVVPAGTGRAGPDPTGEADEAWIEAVLGSLGVDVVRIGIAPDTDRAHLAARLTGTGPAGVISLLGIATEPHPGFAATPTGLALSVLLVQALGDAGITAPLWAVTRGAVTIGADDTVTSPVQSALWGLGRVAALDLPKSWGGLIDLPEEIDDRTAEGLVAALGSGEDQVAVRPSGVHGRRLVPAPRGERNEDWQPRGTALITGGTGALGGHVARWLAGAGAGHLVLTSRRGAEAPGAEELRGELEALGARVTIAACDAADRAALQAVLDRVDDLTVVVHAAGVVEGNAPTGTLGIDQLDRLLRAKTASAWNLHELTADNPAIDAFVLFSSGAASWGSGAQPAYAAANAFLDGLAHHRRGLGLPATSIAWGAWADSGMASANADGAEQLRRRGLHTMAPELAVTALRQAVADGRTQLTVTNTDWAKFAPSFTAQRPSPLLGGIPEVRRLAEAEAESAGAADSGLGQRLLALPASERGRALLELVRDQAAATLGYDEADALTANRAFRDVGFDSVMAVDLRNRLRAATGVALPATLVFDHPTPEALAQFIRAELLGETDDEQRKDDPEAHLRETLASIPISRLRKAGLLDLVLQLAQDSGENTSADSAVLDPDADSIDDLDGEALLRLASENSGN
ncbi:beta-ketoacyl reductase, partial [Streptomyces pacificus]|uniref:beta-ketoacyl reductase n=1 Tax=Streptomyces pacificus TaxID=2705029 RepID=UPI0015635DA4